MDPVTITLLSAFVAGAAKGAAQVGEKSVNDAYSVLRQLAIATYGAASGLVKSIVSLEEKPESNGRRETVAEELQAAGAIDDDRLVAAAEAVLSEAEAGSESLAIGVDWQDVKAARLKIGEIRARAGSIGFRAARMEISGEVEIPKIDAGGPGGNP